MARFPRYCPLVLLGLWLTGPLLAKTQAPAAARWPAAKAQAWYEQQPWLVGCNFIPSTAVNQLEMWQAATFDPGTINRELGWAASLGFNTVRVYLHDIAWEVDPPGFKGRLELFLQIAQRHGIRPILVLFDDCWNPDPQPGPQPAPRPGVHNSGWVRSPGPKAVNDPATWGRLEKYVTDVVGTFGQDERILMWDLYNEPGNEGQKNKSLPLLKAVFTWARQAKPKQPVTAGVWSDLPELNAFQLAHSDVISFHNYGSAAGLRQQIAELKKLGRPVVCTEWLARTHDSNVATHLPIFKETRVACLNWGLVAGKTQTMYPWGSKPNAPEPKVWFHDLFRADGTPFDPKEVELFRQFTARRTP